MTAPTRIPVQERRFGLGSLDLQVSIGAGGAWFGFFPSDAPVPRDWPAALAMNACGAETPAALRAAANWIEGVCRAEA